MVVGGIRSCDGVFLVQQMEVQVKMVECVGVSALVNCLEMYGVEGVLYLLEVVS